MRRRRYFDDDDKSVDIDELRWLWFSIESEGGIFIGTIGDCQCVIATDGSNDLAKLQIAPGENMSSILARLNNAIEQQVENGILTDDVPAGMSITDALSEK